MTTTPVFATRVVNPCVLVEIGDVAILTDPFFSSHRFFPMNEPIGLAPSDLPPLRAIIGGHGVADHWQPRSLQGYRHHASTDVFAPTRRMVKQARRAGFPRAEQMAWGEQRDLGDDVVLTCVEGDRVLGGLARTNNYLIERAGTSVFVGSEACSVVPIRRLAQRRSADVDIAVLPIDGLTFGRKQLVMDAETAIVATQTLGARTLVPIHYSQRPVRGLWRCPSGISDLQVRLIEHPTITAVHGSTGERLAV